MLRGLYGNVYSKELSKNFLEIMIKNSVNLLFEIGAHEASFSNSFLSRNPKALAYAFEANFHTHAKFKSLNSNPRLKYLNFGVGDIRGDFKMFIPGKDGLTPGNASYLQRSNSSESQSIDTKMVILDDYLKVALDSGATALWVDVEGMSEKVLLGGSKILASGQVKAIFIEVETKSFWTNGSTVKDINSLLREKGYYFYARDFEYPGQHNRIYVNYRPRQIFRVVINMKLFLKTLRSTTTRLLGHKFSDN